MIKSSLLAEIKEHFRDDDIFSCTSVMEPKSISTEAMNPVCNPRPLGLIDCEFILRPLGPPGLTTEHDHETWYLTLVEDPSTLYLHTKSTGRNELWARVWSTSRILAEMLAGQSSRGHLRGLETIEIGCGSALVGLVCARYGGNVLLTDSSEQALALVEQSAVLNKVEVRCARFDWHNIDPSVLSVDLLLGSDVLFVGSNVMAVIGVIRLLRPGALAVIVDPGRPSADDFVTKVSEESTLEMEVLEVEEPVVSANHKLKRVVLYLITVKCAVPNKQLADLKHGLVDSWGWIAQRTAAEGPSTYEYTERVEIRKP